MRFCLLKIRWDYSPTLFKNRATTSSEYNRPFSTISLRIGEAFFIIPISFLNAPCPD
ncbi:uncharacterized protein Dvar_30510 [Desulfosarcina variabilis str. Montpellier]